jgi:beta-glucosidase
MTVRLPNHFRFGTSTASYQIEGAWNQDGKGESIWDRFSHTPGKVKNGDTGDVACDHYRRFEADLDLAAGAGMRIYRFSIAWTRLFPQGTGARNAAGFDFYDRLVDACLARGLEPWPCFYHWDLPQALQDRGGWANRDSAAWYADYAAAAAERLKDRAPRFVMFNEPSIFTTLGHLFGIHAPGLRDMAAYGAGVHHVNLATAEGLRRLRGVAPAAELGTVLALNVYAPATESVEDRAAAAYAEALMNRNFADPLFFGCYPEAALPVVGPHIRDGDLDALRERVDFLGVNHYSRTRIAHSPKSGMSWLPPEPGAPVTAFNWEIWPQGMRDILVWVRDTYGDVPLYVTENGMAGAEVRGPDGRIDDQDRIDYLRGYIGAVAGAIEAGVDVRGYLVWSLIDNFEWAEGNAMRFGLIETDYATLERRPKRSYDWYADVARTGTLAG